MNEYKNFTLIELFAGIGTQYQAFKDHDPNIINLGISEIDPRPLKAYKILFNDYHNFGDITKIQKLPKADIWTYSFPCTNLSIAGKKEGFSGEESSLIYEVYRLLTISEKPKILIMENVANIVSQKFMPSFQDWINSLAKLGYTSHWKKIKAFKYGSATIRERVFMISILNEESPFIFPKEKRVTTSIKDFLEPEDDSYFIDNSTLNDITSLYTEGAKKLADYKNGGQGNRIYSILGQGVTLTSSGGGKAGSSGGLYLRGNKIYKLSPIEMCKVMGWSKKEAEKICSVLTPREVGFVMGNAIDRIVMSCIAKEVLNYLNNIK